MIEHVQKGIAEVNGTSLYHEVAGQGHPLVLNHGGLVDNHLWEDQFDEFARHFKVIRYDIRGFGDSGMIKNGMDPYSMERALYSLLQFLGIEETYVLGLSMGGSLAIDFTLQYPEMVDALIIVGDQDVELILEIANTLEKGIVGAKKVVIPGTAHHLNMEKPEEFNRVVIEFLERLSSLQ